MKQPDRSSAARFLRKVFLTDLTPRATEVAAIRSGAGVIPSERSSIGERITPPGRSSIGDCITAVVSITALAGIVALFIGLGGGGWANAWLIVKIVFLLSIVSWIFVDLLGWASPPDSTGEST